MLPSDSASSGGVAPRNGWTVSHSTTTAIRISPKAECITVVEERPRSPPISTRISKTRAFATALTLAVILTLLLILQLVACPCNMLTAALFQDEVPPGNGHFRHMVCGNVSGRLSKPAQPHSSTHKEKENSAANNGSMPALNYDRSASLLPFSVLRLTGAGCGSYSSGADVGTSAQVRSGEPNGLRSSEAEDAIVDVVVTYVNPFAVGATGGEDRNPQRVRDWNELYWNLRSIFYHGRLCVFKGQPDRCLLGRIHLVVASKVHVPAWLARRLAGPDSNGTSPVELRFRSFLRDRLNVVEHKDIFPRGTPFAESYNSNVIELNLHRIPGLSPFYLYFNNDMFLGRELQLQDLFTPVALELMNDQYCDLIPITWFESPPGQERYPYAEPDAEGKILRRAPPARTRNPFDLTEVEQMIEFNIALLTSNYSHPFLQRRLNAGDTTRLPLLRYPHLPMLYDRSTVQWILNQPMVAVAVGDTMTRPVKRGSHDVWVPYMYINTKRLAFFAALQAHDRLFQQANGAMYRFSMLTDTVAVSTEFHHVQPAGFAPELFVTLNDDFSTLIAATAANPSNLLFNDSPEVLGSISCEGIEVQEKCRRAEAAASGSWFAIKAVRNLLRMHEMYCRWESYWSSHAKPQTGTAADQGR